MSHAATSVDRTLSCSARIALVIGSIVGAGILTLPAKLASSGDDLRFASALGD